MLINYMFCVQDVPRIVVNRLESNSCRNESKRKKRIFSLNPSFLRKSSFKISQV